MSREQIDFETLAMVLPEALIVTSDDGTVRYINRATERLMGYSAAQVVGHNVTTLIPLEARRRVNIVNWLRRWASDPDPVQWRYLHVTGRTSQGDELRLAVRVSPLAMPEHPLYAITVRDISDELAASTELKRQHLVTSRVLALSEDAVLLLNGERRIIYSNPSLSRLFGYAAGDLQGQALDMLIPERFRDAHRQHLQRFEQGESPSRMMGERGEIVGLHRDGTEIPLEASITKAMIGDARVFGAHLRDVRARKAAEAALAASERRFRSVFENALEAMALLDCDGLVRELNAAAHELLGEAVAHEAVPTGIAFWDLNWWPTLSQAALGEARARLRQMIEVALRGDTVRERVQLIDASGRQRELDFSIVPALDDSGGTQFLIAEGRDITLRDTPR